MEENSLNIMCTTPGNDKNRKREKTKKTHAITVHEKMERLQNTLVSMAQVIRHFNLSLFPRDGVQRKI